MQLVIYNPIPQKLWGSQTELYRQYLHYWRLQTGVYAKSFSLAATLKILAKR